MNENMRSDFAVVSSLTRRNLKLFLKDKASVFFSLLAPLIVLVLYILFLKKVQLDGLEQAFKGITIDKKLLESFLNAWLVSGMLSIGCVTVSLSANTIRVRDKELGIMNDIIVSPVKQYLVKISYYLFNFLVTIIIMSIVFVISLIYLAIVKSFKMNVGEVFALYGTLVFSALSATFITSFITEFCKSMATLSALVGIASAMVGFVMGAYMPLDIMPEWMQYIAGLLPGTHSAGMMREFLMTGALEAIEEAVPIPSLIEGLSKAYCMKLNFFGKYISSGYMSLYIGGTTVLFFVINLLIHGRKKSTREKKLTR